LRKVLGFTPTIDQAFGYGRGVHNLVREVHPSTEVAALAKDPAALEARLSELVGSGVTPPSHHGRAGPVDAGEGVKIVADYVTTHGEELSRLEFVPERHSNC
jgi:DNA helicase-2/ATP-dependent DNA helicase PcrA